MAEKPASLSVGRKTDEEFKQSDAGMDGNAASFSTKEDGAKLLQGFRKRIDENKKEIFERHRVRANEYFNENLNEPEKEEMPRIIELDQDGFYRGDLAEDESSQAIQKREKSKKFIDMNEFFEAYPDRKAKTAPKRGMRVTLTGKAGSGKTITLNRFAREATNGRIDQMKQKDHLVHQINCRELRPGEKISVPEFLFKTMSCEELSKDELEAGYKWMQENPQKITFVIDSLDTMSYTLENVKQDIMRDDGVMTPDVILHNLLTGKLFRESSVLTSSREHEIRNYKGSLRADKIISLDGLEKKSMESLTIGFLGEKKEGRRVFKKLEAYPTLMELCKTPVFLIFAIIGLKKTDSASAFVPESMAGVLVNLINSLFRSEHARTHERYSWNKFIAAINKMKNLAYNGTMRNKVLYTEQDLKDAHLTPDEITDIAIIVPGRVNQQILDTGAVSFFIHQTVGELFCALKICEKNLKDFQAFAAEELFKPKFVIIKQLVYGILLNSEIFQLSKDVLEEIHDHESKANVLKEILRRRFNEAVKKGKRKDVLELFHVIHESGDGGVGILPSDIEKMFLGSMKLTPSDTFALGGSICNSSTLQVLDLCKCELTAETIEALRDKLDGSNLRIKELNVSWNWNLGVNGYFSVGCLGQKHRAIKLGMDFCEPTAEELDALHKGLGTAKLEQLDASMNVKLGVDGFAAMGRLVREHGVGKLEITRCELKSNEVDSIDKELKDGKVLKLDVSLNENLGVDGCFSIGRFVSAHEVNKLKLVRCKLKPEEVDSFEKGLGNAALVELDISSNTNLGEKGLASVGRLVKNHGVEKLRMRGCELKLKEAKKFREELGDAKLKNLILCRQRLALPMDEICKLLRNVTECLDLRHNKLSEDDQTLLLKEWEELHMMGLDIKMDSPVQKANWDPKNCIVAIKEFSAEVEPTGKEVWVNDCIINFPEGSFNEKAVVKGTLEIDSSKWPPNYFLITPVIYLSSKSKLNEKTGFSIKASSWCMRDKKDVNVNVLRLPSGSSMWKVIETQSLTDDKFFQFDCSDFSPVAVGLPIESLDSACFNIDVCLYATGNDVFSTTFSLGDEKFLAKVKENMAQSKFELKHLFNIKAKRNGILKAYLSAVKPIDFSMIPDANFFVTVNDHFLTMHMHEITTSELDSDKSPEKPERIVLRYEIYNDGKMAIDAFGFSHDYGAAILANDEEMDVCMITEGGQVIVSKTTRKVIGLDGGVISVGGCVVTFAKNSFRKETEIVAKAEINCDKWPKHYYLITPMLYVNGGEDLLQPATVHMRSWCAVDKTEEIGAVDLLHRARGSTKWDPISKLSLANETVYQFECMDFSPYAIGIEECCSQNNVVIVQPYLFADDKNNLTYTFTIADKMVLDAIEKNMAKSQCTLKKLFSTLNVKEGDKIKVCLRCVRPVGFTCAPVEARFIIETKMTKGHKYIKSFNVESDARIPTRIDLESSICKNDVAIEDSDRFFYDWQCKADDQRPLQLEGHSTSTSQRTLNVIKNLNILQQTANVKSQQQITAGTLAMDQGKIENQNRDSIFQIRSSNTEPAASSSGAARRSSRKRSEPTIGKEHKRKTKRKR